MSSFAALAHLPVGKRLATLDSAWKIAFATFIGARILYSVWAILIVQLNPQRVNNLDLYGTPVLAVFDARTSSRYVYSRALDGTVLDFYPGEQGFVLDNATQSVWALADGRSVQGQYAGRQLGESLYSADDVFPYRQVQASANPLLAPWQRFDTNWYLKIASQGYSADDGSAAFFPLYPILIRVLGFLLLGHDLLAAVVVSNLALVASLYLLFKIAEPIVGHGGAMRSLVYLVVFPTGFFFFAAYTESVFMFFSLACLYAGLGKRWWAVGLWGALASFTRLQGLVLFLPAALMWYQERRVEKDLRTCWYTGLPLLLIPVATVAFVALMNLSFLSSLQREWNAQVVFPWEPLLSAMRKIAGGQLVFVDLLNLVATLLFAILIVAGWRRVPTAYSLFAASLLVAPLFRLTPTQPLVSMSRYVLPIFPAFILLGKWGENGLVNRLILYGSLPLGLYLSAQFALWGWVA